MTKLLRLTYDEKDKLAESRIYRAIKGLQVLAHTTIQVQEIRVMSEEEIAEALKNNNQYVAIDRTMQQELGGIIKKWSRKQLAHALFQNLIKPKE